MVELIDIALAYSIIVQFIYACFWEGMVLGKVAGWLSDKIPYWMQKPIFDCPICMTPYYSVIFALILHYTGLFSIPIAANIIVVLLASGFSTIFSTLYNH